jgi:hypothetical protein
MVDVARSQSKAIFHAKILGERASNFELCVQLHHRIEAQAMAAAFKR